MKKVLLLLLAAVAVGVGYPLLNENANNSCLALEKRWLTVVGASGDTGILGSTIARAVLETGEGIFAREYVRRRVSELPPVVTCYGYYWYSMANKPWLYQLKPDL